MAEQVRTLRLVYDIKLRKPGCVLLQAVMGGMPHLANELQMVGADWLINPTPDLKLYEITEGQFARLKEMHNANHRPTNRASTRQRRSKAR